MNSRNDRYKLSHENNFEIWDDTTNPQLKRADISDYRNRLKEAIYSILEASFKTRDPKEFFKTIVEIGERTLDTKCCSIFLLDRETSVLRLMDASGAMSEPNNDKASYIMPEKRQSFTKSYRESNKPQINKVMRHFRDFEKTTKQEIYKGIENKRNAVADNKDLPMGITTYVVKEGIGVIANGVAIREHPEWLGGYEDTQEEICTSIIMVPLKIGEEVLGLIKMENHVDSPAIIEFDDLKNEEIRKRIKVFGPEHIEVISILADSVALAIQEFYGDKSYKNIFGSEILQEAIVLLSGNVEGKKNKNVGKIIMDFCEDVIKWDIVEVSLVYQRIIDVVEDIFDGLGLSKPLADSCLNIYRNLVKYENLLTDTDISYREHFIHQFQVFLIGYCIINKNNQVNDLLKCYLGHKAEFSDTNDELLDKVITCWFVTAILHDLAYSIERIHRWLGSYFRAIFPPPVGQGKSGTPEEFLQQLKLTIPWGNILAMYRGIFDYHKANLTDLICERINVGIEEDKDHKTIRQQVIGMLNESLIDYQDHGLFGGLILMHVSDGEISEIINEASLAIALHSSKIYRELKNINGNILQPRNFPFAFLLVFCDNAQQWGRPQMQELVKDTEIKLKGMKIPEQGDINIKLGYSKKPRAKIWEKIREPWECWEEDFGDIKMKIIFEG